MIKAEIIADSKNEHGQRLTTFVLTFPRIVLAEFNTHRMLSRNSASSRAIPFKKMVEMVKTDPFIPIKWQKDHKGMQGMEYFTEKDVMEYHNGFMFEKVEAPYALRSYWLRARNEAVKTAEKLNEKGLTKQLCNRLLEPFMWHTVICTGTEWENFFALRAHPDAEIHIQQLAYEMLHEYTRSEPKQLKAGEWHMPFGDKIEASRITASNLGDNSPDSMTKARIRIATARCARVSYLNFEGNDDLGADIRLHQRLLESGHMSPFEHCARAMSGREYNMYCTSIVDNNLTKIEAGWCGNFRGFIQYRKMINDENKRDRRVIPK